jgi:hypothetical protein
MKKTITSVFICLMLVITVIVPATAVEKSKSLDNNSGDSLFSNNKKIAECNGAILQFYFDEETKRLYLRNIGDEIAYNVTLLIEIEGFIILGFGNHLTVGIDTLEPDEETSIVFYPIIIGIGPIRIIHTASAINADSTSITLKALLIGFFILGLRI